VAIKVYNGATYDDCLGTQTVVATGNNVTTSFTYGATFTAPNTTNAVTGVVFFVNSLPSSGDFQFEVSESGVQKATVTVLRTDLTVGWNYARFTTPYVFTTTSAGAYKIGVKNTSANSGSLARDGGGTSTMLFCTYDTATSPASTDDLWFGGVHNSGLTPVTYTFTGTGNQCGSGTDRSIVATTTRTTGAALTVMNGATVNFDTTANSKLICKGAVQVSRGGTFDFSASSTDLTKTVTLEFDNSTADGDFGIIALAGSYGGRVLGVGKTVATHVGYTSGLGTAANPVITDAAHGFAVGDELVFAGNSYSTNQLRYVISIPTSTQLVLSTTAGGGEVALSATVPATSKIANLTRNCIVKNSNTARGFWMHLVSDNTVSDLSYSRLEYANCQSGKGINLNTIPVGINGLAIYNNSANGRNSISINGSTANDYGTVTLFNTRGSNYAAQSGLVLNGSNATVSVLLHYAEPSSTTNCAALSFGSSSVYNTVEELHSYGANAGNSTSGYAIGLFGVGDTVRYASVHGSRQQAIYTSNSQSNQIIDGVFGTFASNTVDMFTVSNTLNTALFTRCTFGSATLISNYLNTVVGTEIRFHEMDGNTSKHRWYTNRGSAWSSGSGLTDTTVRTASSLAVALKPENATDGFVWEFLVPAVPTSQCGVFGYGYRNATFSSGTFKVELFLPGSTVADASYTFATTTGSWLPFNISAYYSGSVTRYSKVLITGVTATASAYAFIDDLYDAGTGNKIAGLDLWHEGQPSQVMVAADYSAVPALVWGYSDQTTSADTMGQQLVDKLDTSAYTTPPTAAAIEAEVLDSASGVETGLTVRNALRLLSAVLAGELSGADTTTITIRNAVADSKDRVTATVDANGNRTAITYDLTD
jgi:hypothetical protein